MSTLLVFRQARNAARRSANFPLTLDPELLGELREKVPATVIEQLTHNWQKQTEALAQSQKEHRLLRELLRLMRVEKYGPASERLSDE